MAEPIVYLNGRTVAASKACLPIFDAGVVWGATVTEQARTFHHHIYKLDEHLDRLYCSLRIARMEIDLTPKQVSAICLELTAHNGRFLEEGGELGLIIFVTAGEVSAYSGKSRLPQLGTTVCMHTFPLAFEIWAKKMRAGAHLITPSIRQIPAPCQDPRMKCRSRMHYYLADKEAQAIDPEASALLLDLDDNITETSAANFFLVEQTTLVSPPVAKILPGISRTTLIELAAKLDIPFQERDIQVANALSANEAMISSTPFCLIPVTRINGVPIADGKPGALFRKLLNAWSEEVGVDIEKQIVG